ncbi:hypothetical protein [Sphingomonas sp. PAMC 26621]|uniref:hypothetical protein n=1 Tax=Sphingomonas sp. PAMC 26621 TaxID=1112213 RepID=UPI000288BAFC|nr:hypothetical protein [Sphingomonas sp. PAMC 26621]
MMTTVLSETDDKIAAMAKVMVDTFGARAVVVAQAQAKAAATDQPPVAETWRRIGVLIEQSVAQAKGGGPSA